MFKKILQIKNYGKFSNFIINSSDWDGVLKKVNVIYAPNGSGKTSLSVLFNSIMDSKEKEIVLKKQTFDSKNKPYIKFILDDNKELIFRNGWNKTFSNIEVFDSFYYEENLYSISINDDPQKPNIFEISISEDVEKIKKRIIELKYEKTKLSRKISNRKSYLRKNTTPYETDDSIIKLLNNRKILEQQILELNNLRLNKTEEQRNRYVKYINKYLALFCDNMCLTEIKTFYNSQANIQNIIYGLKINGHNIAIEDRNNASLKYFLSDGDKNALALSFFLARMDMLPNLDSYVVVVDDPFTSFDTHRKMTTVTQLVKLSEKVNQFFLLTHDLHFANDFNNANTANQILNLKIQNCNLSSALFINDLKYEMLTGFNKDLMTLRNFIDGKTGQDTIYLREVVRCIRPTIEGIFRIKYFNYIKGNKWLGDFIEMIRNSDTSSPFYRLREYLEDIEEINNYSKIYHHSNPNHIEIGISYIELKNYVRRTLTLVENL